MPVKRSAVTASPHPSVVSIALRQALGEHREVRDDASRCSGRRRRRPKPGSSRFATWHAALRDAPERDGAFGELVGVGEGVGRELVEERVERLEVGALHVPVGLLGLVIEVERVREARVEQLDGLLAGGGGEVVAGGVHGQDATPP
jgi:hypothetical protein